MNAPAFTRLTVTQVGAWLAARPQALILDAREAAHHQQSHLAGALRLDGRNHERLLMGADKARPVFLYCHHGNASQTYASMFKDFGFAEVADLVGGWAAVATGRTLNGPLPLEAAFPSAPAAGTADAAVTPATSAHPLPADLSAWLAQEGFDPQDPESPSTHGNTPLMHAAWRGAGAAVSALLALGVRRDATNGDGNNALWLACVNGDGARIRELAAAGVPLDHANLTGATALMYAASAGKTQVLATLLDLGADPLLQTQDDFSALDMAANLDCLRLLRAATRCSQPV